jgi:predicted class III extradiol MEMO1 family dioxygenase
MKIMRSFRMYWLAAQLVALLAFAPLQHMSRRQSAEKVSEEKIRQAGVAGSFYPADPKVLSAMIDEMLAHATPPPIKDPILAVVAPHAGYQYSGPVAAYTYAALKGRKFSRVVVIAPSHYEAFDFTSVYEGDAYATPLGTFRWTRRLRRQLVKMSSTMQLSSRGHDATSAGANTRSRCSCRGCSGCWALSTGAHRHGRSELREQPRAGRGAGQAEADSRRRYAVLASSDLSHYHPTTRP